MSTLVLVSANLIFLKPTGFAGVSLASVLASLPLMSFNKPLLHIFPEDRLNNHLPLLMVIKPHEAKRVIVSCFWPFHLLGFRYSLL